MEEKHYIEWIKVIGENEEYIKFLNPGDEPKAIFNEKIKEVIIMCNIHGLWHAKS